MPVWRRLDSLGDHRSACAQVGVLAHRAGPLERAAARICREAGVRVATSVALLRELNLDVPPLTAGGLRSSHGLPLWRGAQIAVDTTLVRPVQRVCRLMPLARRSYRSGQGAWACDLPLVSGCLFRAQCMPPALASAIRSGTAATRVREAGFPVPDWSVAAAPAAPHPPHGDGHLRGWQRTAVAACDEPALETHLSHLNPASRALLLSQAGPHSGRASQSLHINRCHPATRTPLLLLRRLRLPLPLTPRTCPPPQLARCPPLRL